MEWTPNRIAFDQVCKELEDGQQLTLSHIGRIFGQPFWEMTVFLLLDSQDAARAIQGAIARLAGRPDVSAKDE